MNNKDFTTTVVLDATPEKVFDAIKNVRGWWSEEIEGGTENLNEEFTYRYKDVHNCRIKLAEVIPNEKMVWHVLDNHFSFTKDNSEWVGTNVIFELAKLNGKTQLRFTHQGLVPAYECYDACVSGWTQYIQSSLQDLVTTGKGKPNSKETAYTTHEVAARFYELAKQEKWFEIQDELFADDVKSIEPENSRYLSYAEGKEAVRKKAEDFVKKVEAVHKATTTPPVVAGHHFAVGRDKDLSVQGHGRVHINEIMLYEVKDGKIVSEQFFYSV